jgi:hypothetical protein
MPVAHTIDLPARRLPSSTPIERSGTASRVMLLALVAALAAVAVLLGCAYFGTTTGDGYPDSTQQWTD